MKTILVPTDFSDAATNAAEYAAHLAKDMNANIILFHTYHFPTPVSEVPVMVISPDELQEENETLLKEYAARLEKKTGVRADYRAKIGLAADEIIQEGVAADLIVMGMRGAGKLSEALIGSIATSVLRKSQVPVLVIPERASYTRPEKIVFACDYDPRTNMHKLIVLKELLKTFKAKLYVLNVKKQKETVSVEEAVAGVKLENELYDVEHVYYFPESDDLVSGINEFVNSHKADMVVTIPHVYTFFDRLFHKSISKKMAFNIHVPLLALPDTHKSASAYFL
ncbi:MAG: universal stress protein [Bacteroidia bacterium]|jgi:nucleotide-binding universal stress UspA family protein